MPIKTASGGNQEFDDATLLSNGNVIFSRMSGAGMVNSDKKLLWDYPAPAGTEIHSCQSIGKDRVLIMRNGNPAQAMIYLRADEEVPFGTIAKVMDRTKQAGVENISIVTQPLEAEKK